jgi:hypothetical protein
MGMPSNTNMPPQPSKTTMIGVADDDLRGGAGAAGAKGCVGVPGMVTLAPQVRQGPVWPAKRSSTLVCAPQFGQVNEIAMVAPFS